MEVRKVTIIGLGLIGGSLARAITERTGISDITAVTTGEHTIEEALNDGTIKQGFTCLNEYVYDSDIIFLCTPIKQCMEYLEKLQYRVGPETLITDVCSTKAGIINYVEGLTKHISFIGGHPMAGSEKTGYRASSAHLFENAFYILTPCKFSNDKHMSMLKSLVSQIGGIPVELSAEVHDKVTAGVSHVPHIVASALVNLIRNHPEAEKMHMLAAGGFRDITRIASADPALWESIVTSNKEYVAEALEVYIKNLEEILGIIRNEKKDKIFDFFDSAKSYRDSFRDNLKGPIIPSYEIVVDVVDRPGVIGKITTILGNHNINIKNLSVTNSREFENGCLRILLSDHSGMKKAVKLLSDNGYKVYEK